MQIAIDDAQYVYRPMPSGIRPSESLGQPYFINMIEEGVYVGRSDTKHQFNTFSFVGFDYMGYEEGRVKLVIGPKELIFAKPEDDENTTPGEEDQTPPSEDTTDPPMQEVPV